MPDLRHAIRQALANPALQAALDANAERRREARARAHASLPEPWEVMRHRAAEVRAEVLAHWEEVFDQFVAHARRNGFRVHLAADAAEARRIILGLVASQGAGPRLVVKSKSMVTEEIGLNAALEAAGHRVVETDLGEFIIQLRHERPAHIITPAVHLRRQEVAQTFHDLLGIPYTEDVEAMTATARRHLREAFLQADVGISGVNFGIAETGGICIVTNEGNGRMVTTLPRLHIAVMGAERLVRSLDDLALMLELLPRSATGQDLTVYTTLIHGPRREGETDTPPERHLVIVDNGRRRMAQTSLADALRCIRCGACLNTCPVFQEIGGHAYVGRGGKPTPYPGPIGVVISPGLFGFSDYGNLPYLCTLCGACAEACPVEVPLPDLILQARRLSAEAAQAAETAPKGESAPPPSLPRALRAFLGLYARVATQPALFRLAQRAVRPLARLAAPLSPIPLLRGVKAAARKSQATTRNSQTAGHHLQSATRRSQLALRHAFTDALTALRGEVVPVADMAQAGEAIVAWLQREGITRVWAWDDAALPPEVVAALDAAGVVHPVAAFPLTEGDGGEAEIPRVGLTGALAGIAATGSLVLPAGPGQPQTASLLPETHLAVLRAADIVPDLAAALALPAVKQAAMTSIITGPSRTADIEMTLTIGVHGPKRVVVFVVE